MKNLLSYKSWSNSSINEWASYNNMGFTFDDIIKIQTFLVNNSFMGTTRKNGKPSVDGKFGEETKVALVQFQKSKNLDSNGTIDSKTLAAMNLNIIMPIISSSPNQNQPKGIKPGVQPISQKLDSGGDFIEIIHPSSVKLGFTPDFKRLNINEWIDKGYMNFINLTYFEPNGRPSGNFYSNGVNLGEKLDRLNYWPMMTLKPQIKIYDRGGDAISPIEAFSGSQHLIENGVLQKIYLGPSESAVRPRTGVGLTAKGDVIVYVTPKANVLLLAEKMKAAGAIDAINMDSGESTLFVRNGYAEFSTKRPIPTILAW